MRRQVTTNMNHFQLLQALANMGAYVQARTRLGELDENLSDHV